MRVYLLSDLRLPNFQPENVRLAVFLNAFMLSADTKQAIRDKLQTVRLTFSYSPFISLRC